jgi:HAD superfamily hydrolase (TIGR01484 family)
MLICGEDGNLFFQGKKLLKAHVMSWDLINDIRAVVKGRKDLVTMYSSVDGETYWEWEDLQRLGMWSGRRYRKEDSHELDGTEKICRIHCVCPGGEEAALVAINGPLAVLKEKCDVLAEGHGWVGVMEKGMNKGMAVKLFMEHLGIGPDEVAVFGDNENDVPMFSEVKYSDAMNNALPEIQAKAAFVTRYDHTVNGAMRQLLELTEGQEA